MDKGEHRAEMAKLAQERRDEGLPGWKCTVRLRGATKLEGFECRDAVVAAIKSSAWLKELDEYDEELPNVLMEMEDMEEYDQDAFNYLMDILYNLADADRVWIEK